ncbi:MAG: ribonuclease III [Nitrospirota bacterium]|nr:ribonuclease III [Nitrospirota bacterium]
MPQFHALQQRMSYDFRNAVLLERALTHKSFANENRLSEHNERMEFLGDAVLNLVVSEILMEMRPQSPEGELSRLRASVVSEQSLAAIARSIGLGEFLRLGKGEAQTGGRDKDSLLADSLEALIASLYLDGGLPPAAAFISRFFLDSLNNAPAAGTGADAKTDLQELCQERMRTLPDYRVVTESGPDHQKEFTVELSIKGEVYGRGIGRSKKEAEQRAAREALVKFRNQETEVRRQE